MATRARQSFDDNLSGKGGFGGTGRLKDWKEYGSIVVFVHANSGITPRLFHLIPYVGKDDKGNDVIRFHAHVCHEDPSSFFSKAPAVHCPIERAIDILSEDGTIDDDAIVWEASIGNKQKDRSVSKLDFCGMKGGDWRGSFKARAQYVIVVVNSEKVEDGLQIDVEPQSLGDTLMQVIKKEIESNGQEIGDPRVNPYAFKFTFDKTATPKDMYDVYPHRKAEVSEAVLELLAKPAVDIDNYIEPGSSTELRKLFDAHFKADINIDELFDNVLDFDDPQPKNETAKSETTKKVVSKKVEPEPNPSTEDKNTEENLCETCGGTGKIGKKGLMCPDCEGTGHVEAEEEVSSEPEICETCNGEGTVGKKKLKCPDCDGTGLIGGEEEEPTPEPKKKQTNTDRKAIQEKESLKEKEAEFAGEEEQCGACSRSIPANASVCPFCGAEFAEDD